MSMLYKKQTKIKTNMIKWKTRYRNYNELAKKYNYKNIISTHKKTYEYLYDLVEMIEEPFHIQFSDSDIASLITIIKEI